VQKLLEAESRSCEAEAAASLADLQKEKAIQVSGFLIFRVWSLAECPGFI
jgi:hypothetical protein